MYRALLAIAEKLSKLRKRIGLTPEEPRFPAQFAIALVGHFIYTEEAPSIIKMEDVCST